MSKENVHLIDIKSQLDSIEKKLNIILKKKKLKDPNHPKMPQSSYVIFGNDIRKNTREKILNDNPELENDKQQLNRLVMSTIAKKWKNLNDKERTKFKELADNDKIRYNNEMKSYNSN
jgi:hypothetical protein